MPGTPPDLFRHPRIQVNAVWRRDVDGRETPGLDPGAATTVKFWGRRLRRRAGRNAPRSPKGMRVVRNASGASVTLGLGTGSAQRQFSRREHPLNAPKTAHGIAGTRSGPGQAWTPAFAGVTGRGRPPRHVVPAEAVPFPPSLVVAGLVPAIHVPPPARQVAPGPHRDAARRGYPEQVRWGGRLLPTASQCAKVVCPLPEGGGIHGRG